MSSLLTLNCLLLVLGFVPRLSGQLAIPVILDHTVTAHAGDIVYLQTSEINTQAYVQYALNDSHWIPLSPITCSHGALTVQIPSTAHLPDLLTLRVSADGYIWSSPIFINQAVGYSFDTDQVYAGSSFRIFGRNLFFGRTPTVRLLDIKTGSSSYATVDTTRSTDYLLQASAPTSVVPGDAYDVYVSNGYFGNGSSGSETLVKEGLVGRSGGTDFFGLGTTWASDIDYFQNVYNTSSDTRLSLHTAGDGQRDDTAAINDAVWMAGQAGGGIVYLPAGTYKLSSSGGCMITLPKRVSIVGAGSSQTVMNYGYAPAPAAGGFAACFSNQGGFVDLTLNNVDELGYWPESGASVGSDEVFLQRVVWNIGNSPAISISKASHVIVEGSTLVQPLDQFLLGPLFLQGCAHCEVRGNLIDFAVGGQLFDFSKDVVFEQNKITRDVSVTPIVGSVTHFIAANFAKNFTVMNNTFASQGSAMPTNNDGEVLATEAGGRTRFDEFRGTITSATGNTLTDSSQNFFTSGNAVSALRPNVALVGIISGNGLGQIRRVTSVSPDGHSLTVDRDWDVSLTSETNYATFDWSAEDWIFANNTLLNNYKGIDIFSASASDILIRDNTLLDSDGIMVSPDQYCCSLSNIVRGLDISGNTVEDLSGLRPSYIAIYPREDFQNTSFGTSVWGAIVRENKVIAHTPNVGQSNASWDDYKVNASEGFYNAFYWQSDPGVFPADMQPVILSTIFQNNVAQNSTYAFVLSSGVSGTVLSDNNDTNVKNQLLDVTLPGAIRGSDDSVQFVTTADVPVWNQLTMGSAPTNVLLPEPASKTSFLIPPSEYKMEGDADSMTMLAQQMASDGTFTVRISVPTTASEATRGLLMFRANTSAGSDFFAFGPTQTGQMVFEWRAYQGGGIGGYTFSFSGPTVWVRTIKEGNNFFAWFSTDGHEWHWGGQVGSSFWGPYFVGFASLSDGLTGPPVLFDNFSFSQ